MLSISGGSKSVTGSGALLLPSTAVMLFAGPLAGRLARTSSRLPPVWKTNLAAFVFGYGMFASFVLVPEFVELPTSTGFGFGASVTEAGLFMLPATLGMLLAGPISGRLSSTVGSKVPLLIGALVSCFAFVILAFAHTHGWQIYLAMLVMGVGIGFAFASMANIVVESVPREEVGVATGINTIMRTLGGALGAQLVATLLTSKTIGGSSIPAEAAYTDAFLAAAIAAAFATVAALTIPRARRSQPRPVPVTA